MIKDYPFTLAAGARTNIAGPLRSVRLMSTTGEIILEVDNAESALVAGRAIVFDVPADECWIINKGGSSVSGVLSLGARAIVTDNILSGTVSTVKPSIISTVEDVVLVAGASTIILSADATRDEVLISNLIGNASAIRVGNIGAWVTRGIQVGPGQTVTVRGTEAIYAYSATVQSVGVVAIKN